MLGQVRLAGHKLLIAVKYTVPQCTLLATLFLVATMIIIANSACIRIVNKEGTLSGQGKQVNLIMVPVEIKGANKLGSLYGEMVFNPEVLFPVDAGNGTIAKDALIEYSVEVPGCVIFVIVDYKSISGDGAILVVRFQSLDNSAFSKLDLQNVVVHDASLNQLNVTVLAGSFAAEGNKVTSPTIIFSR
jgi:hypothetical protein